ncbi:hypothetical protein Peur_057767 [Populus x canadensis]
MMAETRQGDQKIRACWSEVSHSQSNACRQTETNSLFIQLINYLEFREQQKYQGLFSFYRVLQQRKGAYGI